jgi:oligopeptide transport system permease protein
MSILEPFRGMFGRKRPLTELGGAARWAMDEISADLFQPAIKTGLAQELTRPSLSYWQDAWMRLKANRQAFTSLIIISFLFLFSGLGPFIWRADPADQELSRISEPPSLGRKVKVLLDPVPYVEIIDSKIPDSGNVAAADLAAPSELTLMEPASMQTVRLKWKAVKGSAGYRVYRSETEPSSAANLGVPMGEVEGAGHLSYDDTFDLKAGTTYYSIVAKTQSAEEATQFATLKVVLEPTMALSQALRLDPKAQAGGMALLKAHPLGTDHLGRDLLARLMYGGRVSLFIGLVAPILETLLGILLGGISGFFGGAVDSWIMRFTDFVMALPFLLFMILFRVVLGSNAGESGIAAMLTAMIVLSWTGPARLTRGQILQLREAEFVQAARLLGAKPAYLISRHLLPNTLGIILVSLTFSVPTAIFTEAFLSFIGMGVVPPTPSWGSMCNDGIQTFLSTPHEFLFPAAVISFAVLAFNLFGDGLRDALDPKMRSR